MKYKIVSYVIGWNQDIKKGHVELKLEGVSTPYRRDLGADELAAIALILQQDPLYLENGYIHTGIELVP